MEDKLKKLAVLLTAVTPINVDGEIEDLTNYVSVYVDGQFSDVKSEILFNPVTCGFIEYVRNLWQGEFTGYRRYSFAKFVEGMPSDEGHFNRWVGGLRIIADILDKK